MMKTRKIAIILAAIVSLLSVGCHSDPVRLDVKPEQVVGCWQKDGTQEFWLYRTDGTGAKWDAAEGFSEDFPSYTFTWSVAEDQLTHVVRGEEIDVPITRIYTITAISSTYMEREEELDTYRLTKVNG